MAYVVNGVVCNVFAFLNTFLSKEFLIVAVLMQWAIFHNSIVVIVANVWSVSRNMIQYTTCVTPIHQKHKLILHDDKCAFFGFITAKFLLSKLSLKTLVAIRMLCVLLPVNVAEFDLSNSVKNGILFLEDPVDKASLCLFISNCTFITRFLTVKAVTNLTEQFSVHGTIVLLLWLQLKSSCRVCRLIFKT